MGVDLLHYRPWRGDFRAPAFSIWPIARVGLRMMFRSWPFWGIYALGLMVFLLFFFGQYLMAWAETQVGETEVPVFGRGARTDPRDLVQVLRNVLKLNGTAETYRNFFWYQSSIVMVVLALAGAMLVGNDLRHGSLPFYLSKPISKWHYVLGKCLAVGVFINMMTTLPAFLLWVEFGLLDSWEYYWEELRLGLGILGYGAVLTIVFSLLLVASASWLTRTVPMIMAWATLFILPGRIAALLVDGLQFNARWRLMDLWNDTYLVGNWLLGVAHPAIKPPRQPSYLEAAAVLVLLVAGCVAVLVRRIRAVEVVT